MPGGSLTIGERVFVNQGATIVAYVSISIGDDCRIGDYVGIYDTDHHPVEQGAEVRQAPVVIGRNVWLGRGAIVLPGVTIGDHAVVGAGSVITSDVPARTLVAGNPARVVRELSAEDGWRRP
jgi:acetyltransferase-like isoleucine patch superfamily enzyme